ncbi:MAG: YggS family pyridoxal phosphate-dependent enzyme [Armatimonadetes bacterium]|nr:YggS family pyridoxal phosphate-dependent enzyme [Armatimonadota bacterium]
MTMTLSDRYDEIKARVARSALISGRSQQDITLIAVSKTVGVESIQGLYDLGHRHFGESRYQEFVKKVVLLPKDIHWHYIGALQSNKAKRIAQDFGTIHTITSLNQLVEISKQTAHPDVFIEVNVDKDPQKAGILPEALDNFITTVLNCNHVRLRGLMTIGQLVGSAEEARATFRKLAELRKSYPQLDSLSMGMSSDYEVAIQEGATHVRVGTALFGERN